MPTGYTYAVESGEITSLRDFALSCARGMGALVMMRDEPSGAEIPEKFEPSTDHHEKALQRAIGSMTEIESLSGEECESRAAAEYLDQIKRYEEQVAEIKLRNERYEAMMSKVRRWRTQAEGIREFMLDQLRISMTGYEPLFPKKLSGAEWREAEKQEAMRTIAYSQKAIADEVHRTAERNNWLPALRLSLNGIDD